MASVLVLAFSAGCGETNGEIKDTAGSAVPPAQEQAAQSAPAGTGAAPPQAGLRAGTVTETVTTAGYTYVLVDDGKESFWAAAPQFAVAVGDEVTIPSGMAMTDYHSKSLDRDFDVVYFVTSIGTGGAAPAAKPEFPAGHPSMGSSSDAGEVDVSAVTRSAGDVSIADIFSGKAELSGQEVRVRGKVVKFSSGIMGKNWIHLQDGTDHEGANDLTVTTDAVVQQGDTVAVTGILATDKDFGAGYRYDVIIEDGTVTVE